MSALKNGDIDEKTANEFVEMKMAEGSKGGGFGKGKTVCPMSLEQFMGKAEEDTVGILGSDVTIKPKAFSTGSFGWFGNGSLTVNVGGQPVKVVVNVTLTVANSKTAAR